MNLFGAINALREGKRVKHVTIGEVHMTDCLRTEDGEPVSIDNNTLQGYEKVVAEPK